MLAPPKMAMPADAQFLVRGRIAPLLVHPQSCIARSSLFPIPTQLFDHDPSPKIMPPLQTIHTLSFKIALNVVVDGVICWIRTLGSKITQLFEFNRI
ncbi:hypothetical protein DZC31_18425 [Stenotrophomonas rhizophila]|nr:hypothetical protein DZC31_18425 [Stenotrophomonas rhizophila]